MTVVKLKGGGLLFSLAEGSKNILGFNKCLERKIKGDHKMFDDQNIQSLKMTTESVFILFKRLILKFSNQYDFNLFRE